VRHGIVAAASPRASEDAPEQLPDDRPQRPGRPEQLPGDSPESPEHQPSTPPASPEHQPSTPPGSPEQQPSDPPEDPEQQPSETTEEAPAQPVASATVEPLISLAEYASMKGWGRPLRGAVNAWMQLRGHDPYGHYTANQWAEFVLLTRQHTS